MIMSSIILDLQKDIYDNKIELSDILRKAHVVAKKLKLSDIDKWINNELNGYKIGNEIPDYRKLKGETKYLNPYHGWLPMMFESSQMEDIFCIKDIPNAIPNIEDLIKSDKGNITYNMTADQNMFISKYTGRETQYAVFFSKSSLSNILTTVKNKILEWTLELEENNVLGNNMKFTQEEQNSAEQISNQTFNFYGETHIENSSIGNNNISSNITNNFEYDKAYKKLEEIESDIKSYNLDEASVKDLKMLIKEAKQKIKSKKSPNIIKIALKSILDFVIAASAGVAATAISSKLNGII